MTKAWISGFAIVSTVAALKTYLVVLLAMPNAPTDWAKVSALFALFFALTTAVAWGVYLQLQRHFERQRNEKLAPGAGEPVAKETIIMRNAPQWGLSLAEADVAIFVVKGFSNAEIADMRGCAIATVKSQLGRIYSKSGLESRYQLIAFVTDEVCQMAERQDAPREKIKTQNVLPMIRASKSAA